MTGWNRLRENMDITRVVDAVNSSHFGMGGSAGSVFASPDGGLNELSPTHGLNPLNPSQTKA